MIFCRAEINSPSADPPNTLTINNFGGFKTSKVKYGVIAKLTNKPASKINKVGFFNLFSTD